MRTMNTRAGLWVLVASVLMSAGVQAADKEPVGRWKYKDDAKTVKVVTIAGSIGAWAAGSFSQYLGEVCANAEIVNRSKTGYGALALKQRFKQQFLRNRRVKLDDERFQYWLLYAGGLNSIGTPEMTIKHQMDTFVMAHDKGVKVVGLSLGPWGDEGDKRWRGFAGLKYFANTRKVVDFVLGRLKRYDALGRYADPAERELADWKPGELPDVAVDLYDSALRDRSAAPRSLEALTKKYERSRKLRAAHPNRDEVLKTASELPQWYLRKELRSFDHIHPNAEGHRLIAKTACATLPAEWKCDCARLDRLRWARGKGLIETDEGAP